MAGCYGEVGRLQTKAAVAAHRRAGSPGTGFEFLFHSSKSPPGFRLSIFRRMAQIRHEMGKTCKRLQRSHGLLVRWVRLDNKSLQRSQLPIAKVPDIAVRVAAGLAFLILQ